ncbi:MAG: N-acetylmuramoyl-L-alanine amidase family protein, partial [Bacillota bacterium]
MLFLNVRLKHTKGLVFFFFLLLMLLPFSLRIAVQSMSYLFPPSLPGVVIIIDPGHGGIDGGTHDRQGLMEKDINLDVGLRLRQQLEKSGAIVMMTRETDVDVTGYAPQEGNRYQRDLKGRVNAINQSGAQLFVSIHSDARYNSTATRGTIAFHYRSPESENLAKSVQKELRKLIEKNASGSDLIENDTIHRDFYILRNATIPGILLEVGFLSHPDEKALLSTPTYREE